MPVTKKRLPPSVSVQKNSLEQTTSLLKQLPEKAKDGWTLKEAIAELFNPITGALDKGYSYEEIAGLLNEKKIAIAPTSLRYYLNALRRKQKSQETSSKRTRKVSAKKADKKAAPATSADRGKVTLSAKEGVEEVISYLLEDSETSKAATEAPKKRGGRSAAKAAPKAEKTTAGRKSSATAAKTKTASAKATETADQPAAQKRAAKRATPAAKTAPAKPAKTSSSKSAPKSTTRGRKRAS